MSHLVFDIETTGLDWSHLGAKLHVMCGLSSEGKVIEEYDADAAVDILNSYETVIGHNIIGFDIPYLEAITGKKITAEVYDTKVMSGLYCSDRRSHSLKSWGETFGNHKGTYGETSNWQTCTPEMIEYCHQDVQVTAQLHSFLKQKNIVLEAEKLEHEVAKVIQKQVANGIGFNIEGAFKLYNTLLTDYSVKLGELRVLFPAKEVVTVMKTKTKVETVEFNPNSNDQIAERFKEKYNWIPEKFTPTGKAVVDIGVLSEVQFPEAKILMEMSNIGKIMGYIKDGKDSWIKHENNGRIHGRINTTGVITGRMSHFSPNMAQVPRQGHAAEVCRKLFIPSEGNVLVGCDAQALELRCLAHYLFPYDSGRLTNIIENEDIHQSNADILKCSRDMAKHFIYAFIYGAQGKKLAEVLGCSTAEAKRLKIVFEASFPGFKNFFGDLTKASMRGSIKALDGRSIKMNLEANKYNGEIEPDYKRLNYLLQSAGAIIMKKALCIAHNKDPRIKFVLNIHDEIQVDCREEEANTIGEILATSIFEAGEYFKFRCPIRASFKVGKNWGETH